MAELSTEQLQKIVKRRRYEYQKTKEFESPEELYDELIASVRKYHPSADISLIEKAYQIAKRHMRDRCVSQGRTYIIHPFVLPLFWQI